jgi:hypothetical protein
MIPPVIELRRMVISLGWQSLVPRAGSFETPIGPSLSRRHPGRDVVFSYLRFAAQHIVGLLSIWNDVKIWGLKMRKVIFGLANSLDNYIARKDGAFDWILSGEETTSAMTEF